ncbi:MAG: acyl-ACP--UDP-N-acetylglucosamine O-acyltransferase [Rhizobiales bacterium]|jgi:UDP-N-acetylglucosamine acyltransferase|nr:acyl-ACP--UDP-N-acetylglucosamine O-acyltransferase [Hyphomicrobiales bacterium]
MADIHRTAIVEDGARIGEGVRIGPYSIIERDAVIEDGVVIHSHVVISGHTTIGAGTQLYPFAAIGGPPQDTSYKGEPTTVIVGPNCIIREHATINRGTMRGRGETRVGAQCFMMVASHVAHDCIVHDRVVLVNNATLGGHVEVGEHAILGGLAAIQQHCRIGAHAFIGGLSGVNSDVIPFASAIGERAELGGLNVVGLKRRGFDRPTIHALRAAYQAIFTGGGTRAERVERVAEKYPDVPPVMMMVEFIKKSGDRPLCSPRA